jgi:hypothetical protein
VTRVIGERQCACVPSGTTGNNNPVGDPVVADKPALGPVKRIADKRGESLVF